MNGTFDYYLYFCLLILLYCFWGLREQEKGECCYKNATAVA